MDAVQTDPRAIAHEDDEPAYWVVFWSEGGATSEEWRVEGARDVLEVLAWARDHHDGRDVVISAEHVGPHGHGIVRLLGWTPSADVDRPASALTATTILGMLPPSPTTP